VILAASGVAGLVVIDRENREEVIEQMEKITAVAI
jgi:hypothetical protein